MNPHIFRINSTHKSFIDKQKCLFNELDKVNVVLPQHEIHQLEKKEKNTSKRSHQLSLKSLRGKESIFKRPEIPLRKCLPTRRVPDFEKNPHKWKKYTLEDVKDEDLSEKSNRLAALSFLRELENNKSAVKDDTNLRCDKILFQKSSMVTNVSNEVEYKQTFKKSKVVMPEYIVGQKIKKEKKIKEKRCGIAVKQLSLSHLTTEDGEN